MSKREECEGAPGNPRRSERRRRVAHSFPTAFDLRSLARPSALRPTGLFKFFKFKLFRFYLKEPEHPTRCPESRRDQGVNSYVLTEAKERSARSRRNM